VDQEQRDAKYAERGVAGKGIDGAAPLDKVYERLGDFVMYPSREVRVAHTLWISLARTGFVAERLRPYGIRTKLIRISTTVARGNSRGDFLDTWSRYLPPDI
jgi:hypothetical protein